LKFIAVLIVSLFMVGCALFGIGAKRAPEIVSSCFSDGENQSTFCKSQRVNEGGKIVTTRCIGSQNPESKPNLRGKCVEKICSEGSNTDCQVKGEFAVLELYAELATAKLFAADEAAQANENMTPNGKAQAIASVTSATPTPTPTPEPLRASCQRISAAERIDSRSSATPSRLNRASSCAKKTRSHRN
jgi:hypothetical protein